MSSSVSSPLRIVIKQRDKRKTDNVKAGTVWTQRAGEQERMKCRWRGGGASGCVEFQGGGSWGACSSGPASTLSVSPTGLDSLSQTHFNIKNQHLSVLVTQSCLTLCDPMDYSPLGSSVHGILQARILEWVAISTSTKLS